VTEIEKIEKLVKFSKIYLQDTKKHNELSEFNTEGYTQSKINSLRDRKQSLGEEIMRVEHEIHCLVVELELAQPEEWRYGNIDIGQGIGHLGRVQREFRRYPEKLSTLFKEKI